MSRDQQAKSDQSLPLATRLQYWPASIEVALMRLLAFLPLRVLRGVGALLGTLLWPVARERRLITLRNLELCFPEKTPAERYRLARTNFRNTAIGFMETAKVWFTDPKTVAKWVEIEGLEHLTTASAAGKGVLVLGFHLTDLELGAVSLAPYCKLAGMYRPHADPVFERAMRRGRERYFPMIPREDVRSMLRWLKSGGCVWYAADQDYGAQHSVFAPFFGIPAATITATSRFAKLSGAAVVPLTHVRTATGIRLTLHPPLASIPSGDEQADATCASQFLETWLGQHPANYLWLHRRFKTRPVGEPSLYPSRKPRHKPDEISGKRFDKWLRTGQVLVRDENGLPVRLALAKQLIELFPCRSGFLPATKSDAEQRRCDVLAAWQQRGLVLAQPERLICPSRRFVAHRYQLMDLSTPQGANKLAQALLQLHDGGASISGDALQLAMSVSGGATVLPLTLGLPEHSAALSAERRLALLSPTTPEITAQYLVMHPLHTLSAPSAGSRQE